MNNGQGCFALRCTMDGKIIAILRNDCQVFSDEVMEMRFPGIVERSSMGEALDFLLEIRKEGAAFDRELVFATQAGPTSMHCIGSRVDAEILIAGSVTRSGLLALYDDLVRMNAEQGERIRELEKTLSDHLVQGRTGDSGKAQEAFLNEVTRLNNDLVSAQRELARKNAELSRTDEIKNRFLGMAAHDLRSPLSVISSYTDTILEEAGTTLQPQHRVYLERVHARLAFMANLVDDLLDTAAIESGRLKLDPYPLDLSALVAECVEMNNMLATKKSVGVHFDAPTTRWNAILDGVRITQALNNLISNAVNFSHPGSTVMVSLDGSDTESWVIIQDFGVGMEKETLDRLFSPFGTATVRAPSGEKSTGLGLLIAKRIAEAHGGSIEISSQVGVGTRVQFCVQRRYEQFWGHA